MGTIWLPIEAYEGLSNSEALVSFKAFLILSVLLGVVLFLIDGYFIKGFLKQKITISCNSHNTKIHVSFGDLFEKNGWKAIGVNNFFDSVVDEDLVSSKSLHGYVIKTYWPNSNEKWMEEIHASLEGEVSELVERSKGNKSKYKIGTTASAIAGDDNFLFVALGNTNIETNIARANAANLVMAVRGMLRKARSCCSNQPLYIPLMGSGLSRVGIKDSVILNLIIVAIVEELKRGNITSNINIVLPYDKKSDINLGDTLRNWKENG
jgi:hypothetical protein